MHCPLEAVSGVLIRCCYNVVVKNWPASSAMGAPAWIIASVLVGSVLSGDDPRVERPCPHMDVDCIRHYFLSTAHCSSPVGHIPDPLMRPRNRLFLPSFNGTLLLENIVVSGLKGDIVEFYINHKTDRAVLAFKMKDFIFEAKKAHFTYLPPAREPITGPVTHFGMTHPTVLFTVVFEGTRPLNLWHSFVHATAEVLPDVTVGSEPLAVKDHGFRAMFNGIFSDFLTTLQEGYLTTAAYYSRVFVQNVLCDFGIRDLK